MSGMDIVYNGKILVREKDKTVASYTYTSSNMSTTERNTISLVMSYAYRFKPSFRVQHVLLDSPAYHAGVQKNDLIMSVNGNKSYEFTLAELLAKFQTKDNQKVRMTIERRGVQKKVQFRLLQKI